MPAGNEKFLSDMRESVRGLMEADPYYADIPIVTERLKDIQGRIDKIVGTAGGICIILVTPTLGGQLANVTGANFTDIRFVARVLVDNNRNQTGKEALDIAIYTDAFWSQIKPDSLSSVLRPDEPPIVLGNDPKWLSYDVIFLTEGGTKIQIPRLDMPVLDPSNPDSAILSSTQPGAAIFFTLDNSPPFPRNPAAQLYQYPIQLVVPRFNDGTRAYLYHLDSGIYITEGFTAFSDPYYFQLSPTSSPTDPTETAGFTEVVNGSGLGVWQFEKIGGNWQLTLDAPNGSSATPPAIPPGFSFYSPTKLRARAWLAGFLPSAELIHTT
jgi:hypothetical protein